MNKASNINKDYGNATQKTNAWIALFAGVAIFSLCLHSISSDWDKIQELNKVHEFLTTSGTITRVDVREDTAREDVYYPKVGYSYSVEDDKYGGWMLSYEKSGNSKQYWLDRLEPYQVGKQVRVYYHPQDHSIAVLERKHDEAAALWISISFAGVFLVGSFLLILLSAIYLTKSFFS